jgi:diacylglycerol kinase
MSQPQNSRNRVRVNTLWSSFSAAWCGLVTATRTQRNMRVHLALALAAGGLGELFRISSWEWCTLVLVIAAVLCLELLNTALEAAVDLISPEPHPLARTAKDAAAAAVLVMASASVILGLVIFLPRMLALVGW